MYTVRDRRLWLAIGLAAAGVGVRLIAIDQPFVDRWSWRQSDVAAIARNYLTGGFHFYYPQIDWAGDQAGYVGTEFPILPFLAACCYRIVGVHEWVGRLQAVIAFGISLPFLFLLVRDVGAHLSSPELAESLAESRGYVAATWALFFYCFAPLSVMTGRCFMPDMSSLSFCLISLYAFGRWTKDSQSVAWFSLAAICISLAILVKATSAIIGAPLAWISFTRWKLATMRNGWLWLFGVITLIPSALWYWHARHIAMEFFPHHFFGAGGIHFESARWYWDLLRRTCTASLTPVLSALALAGLVAALSRRHWSVFHVWLGAMIVFIVVVGYGNRHPWYQLPLVPIAAALAGLFLASLPNARGRRVFSSVVAISFLLLSWRYLQPLYRPSAEDLRAAGLTISLLSPVNSLIVAADYGDPTLFYYGQRKGWHFTERDGIYNGHPETSADAIADMEALRQRGATHMVFYSGTFWWLDYYRDFAQHLDQSAYLLAATPQFKIFALNPATTGNR